MIAFNHFRYAACISAIAAIVGLGGCGKGSDSLDPDKPEEKYTDANRFEKQLSIINIPVEIPVGELERQINTGVTGLLYADTSYKDNGGDNLKVKVWKRENIRVRPEKGTFAITVPLKIWVKGGVSLNQFGLDISEYRDTECALDAHFVSRIGVDSTWQITTRTSANGFDWVKKPVLKIGPVEIALDPIAETIIDAQQDVIARQVDKQVKSEIAIKAYVQQAWNTVQQPIKLSDAYNAWLKISPTRVLMTPIRTEGERIRSTIGIAGYTETIIGKQPDSTINRQLPPLQLTPAVPDSFTVRMSGEISHDEAQKIIAGQVVNKPFSFENNRYQVKVTDVDLYGSGENIVIKAGLTGSVTGTIYLTGQPYFDPKTETVSIRNLDYALDTKNQLVKTASWLAKGRFIRTMQDAFRIPVGNELAQARQLIQQNLTNQPLTKGVFLNGQLHELTPDRVYITPQSLVAVVQAKGKADVRIDGL